jgi:hypothetical protein
MVAKAQKGAVEQDIRAALSRGAMDEAFKIAERAFDAASAQWQASFGAHLRGAADAAGLATGATVPTRAGITFAFDVLNPNAVISVREQAARLVREVSADTKAMIRTVIHRSFVEGIDAQKTARTIRDSIGLTSRMESAVWNFRKGLVEAGGVEARVEGAVSRYRDKLIRRRAETIARTEIMRASNEGQQNAWQQAVDKGFLTSTPVQVWIVTPDDRLCEVCAPMKGQRRAIGEAFVSPADGSRAKTPPLHPNCRCAIGLDIKASRERESRVA